LLPLRALHGLGAPLGRLIYLASPPRYAARTRDNLRQANLTTDQNHYQKVLSATIAETGKKHHGAGLDLAATLP